MIGVSINFMASYLLPIWGLLLTSGCGKVKVGECVSIVKFLKRVGGGKTSQKKLFL